MSRCGGGPQSALGGLGLQESGGRADSPPSLGSALGASSQATQKRARLIKTRLSNRKVFKEHLFELADAFIQRPDQYRGKWYMVSALSADS